MKFEICRRELIFGTVTAAIIGGCAENGDPPGDRDGFGYDPFGTNFGSYTGDRQ